MVYSDKKHTQFSITFNFIFKNIRLIEQHQPENR